MLRVRQPTSPVLFTQCCVAVLWRKIQAAYHSENAIE